MELEKHYGKLNLDVLGVTWYRMLEEHGKKPAKYALLL